MNAALFGGAYTHLACAAGFNGERGQDGYRPSVRGIVIMAPAGTPMDDPLAFFLTWTTYGTWLPGDERGWVEQSGNYMPPSPARKAEATERMHESAVSLDREQRDLVEKTVAEHCRHRDWHLHAVNCRKQHVHAVVTAPQCNPKEVLDQLKAWCTRRLKELAAAANATANRQPIRTHWWTEGGSKRQLFKEDALEAAIRYVVEDQDRAR